MDEEVQMSETDDSAQMTVIRDLAQISQSDKSLQMS